MLLLLVLAGCMPHPVDPPAPDTSAPVPAVATPAVPAVSAPADSGMLPTPYSAEQIRDNHRDGTVIRMRMEPLGAAPFEEAWTFVKGDATSVTIESRVVGPAGAEARGDPAQATAEPATWAELRDHAAFPAAATKRGEGTITVPAGTFQAWVYTVTDPQGMVTVFHFAKDEPGPPVLMVATKGGQEVYRMTMLSRVEPK
jgi:hypothetical protein